MANCDQQKMEDPYFQTYYNWEIHRLMLEDKPRTEAYKAAILSSKDIFQDKVVMDVGAGTGILSMFCAQAGAQKIYAIEASKTAFIAKEIIKENGFHDVIEIIHSRVEDLELEVEIDIIVSEWMGFYLLHESMILSVICARDKYLKPGGLMYPTQAILKCAPCSAPLISFWDNVYGFTMSPVKESIRQGLATKPEVATLQPGDLLTSKASTILSIDMQSVSDSDINSVNKKIFTYTEQSGQYQGVALWFEVVFPGGVMLDTSPTAAPTHWKQTLIVWPKDQTVDEGDVLGFEIKLDSSPSLGRCYDIEIEELDASDESNHPVPCMCGMARCAIIQAFMSELGNEDASDVIDITK